MPPEYCKRAEVCVKACGGMQDPAAEIAAMREALRVAQDALRKCPSLAFREVILIEWWDRTALPALAALSEGAQ